jgi:hypothetical protein
VYLISSTDTRYVPDVSDHVGHYYRPRHSFATSAQPDPSTEWPTLPFLNRRPEINLPREVRLGLRMQPPIIIRNLSHISIS